MLTLTGVTAGYGGGNVLQGLDLHCADKTVGISAFIFFYK